jgi:hypothetical protein
VPPASRGLKPSTAFTALSLDASAQAPCRSRRAARLCGRAGPAAARQPITAPEPVPHLEVERSERSGSRSRRRRLPGVALLQLGTRSPGPTPQPPSVGVRARTSECASVLSLEAARVLGRVRSRRPKCAAAVQARASLPLLGSRRRRATVARQFAPRRLERTGSSGTMSASRGCSGSIAAGDRAEIARCRRAHFGTSRAPSPAGTQHWRAAGTA